jgi:hypothetical protein
VELYLPSLNTPSWLGAQLKHRDNFTFTFNNVFIVVTILVVDIHQAIQAAVLVGSQIIDPCTVVYMLEPRPCE